MEFFKRPKGKSNEQIKYINVGDIFPNPNQPRKIFHQEELEALAESINQVGILQPLSVRKATSGWELIAGERRLRASQLANLEQVPCLVLEVDETESSVLALVENIQRQNLDYLEEAQAMANLMSQFGLNQEEVSRQLGRSQSAVANMLRLLRLTPSVVEQLREGKCTQRHARALLKLPTEAMQLEILEKVRQKNLNVSQTEDLIQRYLSPPVPVGGKRKIIIRDVRLFLNSIDKGMDVMRMAGLDAVCEKEELDEEILLKIRIPRKVNAIVSENVSRETVANT